MYRYNWGNSTPDGGWRQIWRLLGDAATLALALQVGHHHHHHHHHHHDYDDDDYDDDNHKIL